MSERICVVLKADPKIGTGHLMRVKSLLPALSQYELFLVADSLAESMIPLCREYAHVLRCDKTAIPQTVLSLKPKLVLFDHYFLDAECESAIYPHAAVAVIDDLANRRHACHVLFDQGILRKPEDYKGLVDSSCRLCMGPKYALVKPKFTAVTRPPETAKPTVLINYGGADPAHACLKAVKAVRAGGLTRDFKFIVLAGPANPDYEELETLCASDIELMKSTSDMPGLFARCHYAFGAYGGTFLERLCAGLPTCGTSIADNQDGAVELIEKLNLGISLSLEELSDLARFKAALEDLKRNGSVYASNGRALIDGQGPRRITDILKEYL